VTVDEIDQIDIVFAEEVGIDEGTVELSLAELDDVAR
jgi:hypothetical protein